MLSTKYFHLYLLVYLYLSIFCERFIFKTSWKLIWNLELVSFQNYWKRAKKFPKPILWHQIRSLWIFLISQVNFSEIFQNINPLTFPKHPTLAKQKASKYCALNLGVLCWPQPRRQRGSERLTICSHGWCVCVCTSLCGGRETVCEVGGDSLGSTMSLLHT